MPATISLQHWEKHPLTIAARVPGSDGEDIVQADVDSIELKVFNKTSGVQIGVATAMTVADVIFDTLQTDYGWASSVDSTGYNFRYTIDGSFFPTGGVSEVIEVLATPADGSSPFLLWHGTVNVLEVRSS